MTNSMWASYHTHTEFSTLDGIGKVDKVVAKVAAMEQPALGITDHGVAPAMVQLYKAAKKHGIKPYIGVEGYLLDPEQETDPFNGSTKRFHIGLLARNLNGYRALINLINVSHTRPRFNKYPRISLEDLTELSEAAYNDIIVTSGCFIGLVQQALVNDGPEKAKRFLWTYAQLFPNTFVEVQNHSICHDEDSTRSVPLDDDDIVRALVGMADELGLPIIATQDSHYLDQNDKGAHELMKRMAYGGTDPEFPGDSFHVASAEWVAEHYDKKTWSKVEEGAQQMYDLGDFVVPALDTKSPKSYIC